LIRTIKNYYFLIQLREREREREMGRERGGEKGREGERETERVPTREGEVEKVYQLIGRLPGFARSSLW
jgi:hypothetical protein